MPFCNLKLVRSFCCVLIVVSLTYAQTTYYISSSTGNDANNGTTPATPWKTPNVVCHHYTAFNPGDAILFSRGDTFQGEIYQYAMTGTPGHRIVVGAYGTGAKPIIYGDMTGATWTQTQGRSGIWQAFSGYVYSGGGFEDSLGTWVKLLIQNGGNLHFYLNNADSLNKFLDGLTEGGCGYGNDTVWIKTWDGNSPQVHFLHEGNFIRGSYFTIRDLEFRNFNTAVKAVSGGNYDSMIVSNLTIRNCTSVGVFLTGNYTHCIVDSCVIDSAGYTAFYDQFGSNNLFQYDTVSYVGPYILGIFTNGGELCGIGFQNDTSCVCQYSSFTNVSSDIVDTYYNVNDTVRYCTGSSPNSGIYLNGTGWVCYNNNITTTTASNGVGIRVNIHGTGQTSAYNNTLTLSGSGQVFGSSEPGGGTCVFHNNNVTLTGPTNTRFDDFQITTGVTSTNNSFRGTAVFNAGLWPNEHLYNTLASFEAATGYEKGSVWFSGSGSPTGTFIARPDSLPTNGGTVTLQWTSLNATTASISYAIGIVDTTFNVNTNGSLVIDVTATTIFTLNLTGPFGTTTLNASVVAGTTPQGNFLNQNHPNPFNAGTTTTIEYGLANNENVSLKVYDILGREIATLAEGMQASGPHVIQWNPKGVASGVYRYRLTAGSYSKTLRMVIVR